MDAQRSESRGLVLDEAEQRADHDGESRRVDERGDLVGEALAAARGEDGEDVAAREGGVYALALRLAEVGEPERRAEVVRDRGVPFRSRGGPVVLGVRARVLDAVADALGLARQRGDAVAQARLDPAQTAKLAMHVVQLQARGCDRGRAPVEIGGEVVVGAHRRYGVVRVQKGDVIVDVSRQVDGGVHPSGCEG